MGDQSHKLEGDIYGDDQVDRTLGFGIGLERSEGLGARVQSATVPGSMQGDRGNKRF